MVYRNSNGYLADQTLDTMDSCMRASVKSIFSNQPEDLDKYCDSTGWVHRGDPTIPRPGNVWNTTRDQLVPYYAALAINGNTKIARKVFYATLKRLLLFAQDFQYSDPGTWKKPWPTYVTNDQGQTQLVLFNFADPYLPSDVGLLALATRSPLLYPLVALGWLFSFINCVFNSPVFGVTVTTEQNQLQCQVKAYGPLMVKIYKYFNPNWQAQVQYYWSQSRTEQEYAGWIIQNL